MVQPRGDRRREDRPGTDTRAEKDGRLGDRRVPVEQGDPVTAASPIGKALLDAIAAYRGIPLSSDPVEFPHRFRSREDIESAAFIAGSFAFGNVAQIRVFLERLFAVLGPSPHAALTSPRPLPGTRISALGHRFVSPAGVRRFLACLRSAYLEHGSLESLFLQGPGNAGPRERLAGFLGWFRDAWGPSLYRQGAFLFPDPLKGSACKRHNLFLRWMVRGEDGVDFGIWTALSPRDLVVPLDTHMARMGRCLGLTRRRVADWKTAEEITAAFRKVCPEDPVRFDFALTRIGILKACTVKRRGACDLCPLARVCDRSPQRN